LTNITKITSTSATTLQRRIIELRLDGQSFEEIAVNLDVPTADVIGHLIEALKRIPDLLEEESCTICALELHRLDALQYALREKAAAGDPAAIDSILRVMQRRAKLAGILPELKR